jgi:hypothetical protein
VDLCSNGNDASPVAIHASWTMATMDDDDDESSASTDFLHAYMRNLQVGDSDDDEAYDTGRSAGDNEEEDAETKPGHAPIIRPCCAAYNAATATTSTTVTLDELMRMMASTTTTAEDARTILLTTMGNIALCRGDHGKKLHLAGAVPALTQLLLTRVLQQPVRNDDNANDTIAAATDRSATAASLLLLPILAAIRDLSCANPTIRTDFYHLLPVLTDLLVQRNEQSAVVIDDDDDDLDDEDGEPLDNINEIATLPFQTALVGTLRNLAHSNGRNGRRLHDLGVTDWLVAYLQQLSSPPPPSSPHRELYFRAVGTLLAIVEKVDVAVPLAMSVTDQCLMDDKALPLSPPATTASAKASTRTAAKLYHPGLLKLIRTSHEQQPQDRYAILLDQEAKRQAVARLREAQQQQQRVVVVAKDR